MGLARYSHHLPISSIPDNARVGNTDCDIFSIAHDEEGHVLYLEAGLTAAGASPVAACTYNFPMLTPQEFVKLASVIEGLGVSVYLGATADITSKTYLTIAGSILVTEALHQSSTRGAVGEIPMSNVFGTPLGINAVYTIASAFIASCPKSNMRLPVKAYPSLVLISGLPTARSAVIGVQPEQIPSTDFYVTFVSGLNILPVEPSLTANDQVFSEVPPGVSGQSYVFLTSDNSGVVNDTTILAGPAVIEVTSDAPTFNLTIS